MAPPHRPRLAALLGAIGLYASTLAFGGCGGGDGTSPEATSEAASKPALALYSDNRESGDPKLGGKRIRITRQGVWTPVYWLSLKDLRAGEVVLAAINIQLTNCTASDLTHSSNSSCKGTVPYDFEPTVETRLMLAPGAGGRPKPQGTPFSSRQRLRCTSKLHHCVPVHFGEIDVGPGQTGDRTVALFVRAQHPQAKRCSPPRPQRCNVLQLTHGQGRLGVARESRHGLRPPPKKSTRELVTRLHVAKTSQQKKKFQKVVYSVKLTRPGPMIVKGRLRAQFRRSYPTPPLVNKQLVLADSPRATHGKTIAPQNGENCEGKCAYLQPAVIRCLTKKDLDAGHRFLNLVAFASRAAAYASPKDTVRIRKGGSLETTQYDASLAPDGCG